MMKQVIKVRISDIQPSQFYLSSKKIKDILKWFDPHDLSCFQPVYIKQLDHHLIFTDGHTRAWVAYTYGLTHIPAIYDEDKEDWQFYQRCVDECIHQGIHCISDLKSRILLSRDYEKYWIQWCEEEASKIRNKDI